MRQAGKLLESKYHTVIPEIKEDIRIVPGSEKDLEILGLPMGEHVLVVERLAFSANFSLRNSEAV